MHARPGQPRYRFVYRSFYILLDLSDLARSCAASPLISRNRFNLLSFHDRDHGAHDGSDLHAWALARLAEIDIDLVGGRVLLLSMPRVLGYGFNPISLYYCHHADGRLIAVIVEVHNTFGEHHVYRLHAEGAPITSSTSLDKRKRFHVSPFFARSGRYRFHLLPPGERMGVGIRLYDEEQRLQITTTLTGERRALTSAEILRAAVGVPLLTFKVTAAIHWEAVKLWLRGAVFHRKPKPERPNVS